MVDNLNFSGKSNLSKKRKKGKKKEMVGKDRAQE